MKNINWKKVIPHVVAIALFLIVALIYCKPALEGKVLQQDDTSQWKAMAQSSFKFKETHPHFPLWTNSMFCGMPTYQIAMDGDNTFTLAPLNAMLYFGLPKPANFFFLACICFYFLAIVLRCNPYTAMATALSYAYCTYNPIIIVAGHETKMMAIAALPALIAALTLIFNKKYIIGTALTAFTTALVIGAGHLQITYYAAIVIIFMAISFAVYCIKNKETKHLLVAGCLSIFAALIGVGVNAVSLATTSEYGKLSIRGGSVLATENDKGRATKTGLNKDYAMSYSIYKSEPLVMLIPHAYGGSSGLEVDEDKSKAIEKLKEMQPQMAQQLQGMLGAYWGGIGGTSGPPYIGAIICFLAIMGFVVVDGKYKWWILACCIFAFLLSWGKYFDGFNTWMLNNLPAYNKFRAPSMILVIPTFLLCMMATLSLQTIVDATNKEAIWDKYKKGLYVTAGILIAALLFYISADFAGESDKGLLKQVAEMPADQKANLQDIIKGFVNALREDRRALFMNDFIRTFAFIGVAAAVLWLNIKNKLSGLIATIIIGAVAFIDVINVDTKYMNADKYIDADSYTETNFKETPAVTQILKDKSQFRVFNVSQGIQETFNHDAKTSYYLNSIGGYHPAKLSIFQDLIEKQLYNFPNCMPVVNMLNAKYVVQQNQQNGQQMVIPNPDALGNCWFVKGVTYKKTPLDVMNSLTTLNTKDSAVVEEADKAKVKYDETVDSTASVSLVKNDNDVIEYTSKSNTTKFAVFSEVYYNAGWKAYIDGKETEIVKTNYALRGINVPAGQHKITFEFKPTSYYSSLKIASISSGLIWLLLLGSIGFLFWNKKKELV
jgi:Bacterial membrane protein YfhO